MRPERGFSLVAALFLMVVCTLLVLAMSRLSTVQNGTSALAIQQARALQAARAGLEWGIVQAGSGCTATPESLNTAGSGFDEFQLTVSCESQAYDAGTPTAFTLYWVTATAQNGDPAARPDYAYRRLTATLEK